MYLLFNQIKRGSMILLEKGVSFLNLLSSRTLTNFRCLLFVPLSEGLRSLTLTLGDLSRTRISHYGFHWYNQSLSLVRERTERGFFREKLTVTGGPCWLSVWPFSCSLFSCCLIWEIVHIRWRKLTLAKLCGSCMMHIQRYRIWCSFNSLNNSVLEKT